MPDSTAKVEFVDAINKTGAAMRERTDVREDERLFYTPERGGKVIRFNTWFPFEERYWPFPGDKYSKERDLPEDVRLLMLERSYDPDKGAFTYELTHLAHKLHAETHPSKTRKYVGFMLLHRKAAMAALMIPIGAEKPID